MLSPIEVEFGIKRVLHRLRPYLILCPLPLYRANVVVDGDILPTVPVGLIVSKREMPFTVLITPISCHKGSTIFLLQNMALPNYE